MLNGIATALLAAAALAAPLLTFPSIVSAGECRTAYGVTIVWPEGRAANGMRYRWEVVSNSRTDGLARVRAGSKHWPCVLNELAGSMSVSLEIIAMKDGQKGRFLQEVAESVYSKERHTAQLVGEAATQDIHLTPALRGVRTVATLNVRTVDGRAMQRKLAYLQLDLPQAPDVTAILRVDLWGFLEAPDVALQDNVAFLDLLIKSMKFQPPISPN